ncbi:MAG: DNA mismatch repair endonuclease MutL [Candidatus Chromulinivorax sp.]
MNFPKIKILPHDQAIKIAAGEVIERPVNIIKELVENSIDAQATKISIFIEQAGRTCIKIVDNGSGMSPIDIELSVVHHATSKLSSVDDLETIATFGFRGEALTSINAVSNLMIISKTQEDQTATCMQWNFGKLTKKEEVAHPLGTTITITNLFDNIPARQKFLKKDETEWRAIVNLFQAFCLDYQTIHFQLYHHDKLEFNCPATQDLLIRAAQLFDNFKQNQLITLEHVDRTFCSITGAISTPQYYRYDRNQIFIFVNQRWVKNVDLVKAIMRSYAGIVPPQKYPAAIIFLTIDQNQIDVNIHPKKEEIKFLHPKKVETIIQESIKATLEKLVTQQLQKQSLEQLTFQDNKTSIPSFFNAPQPIKTTFWQQPPAVLPIETDQKLFTPQAESSLAFDTSYNDQTIELPKTFVPVQFTNPHTKITESIQDDKNQHLFVEGKKEFTIIGQYHKTYILIEKDNHLIFIDQHAAHERILYEQFEQNFEQVATVQLLFPEIISFSSLDVLTIAPYLPILKQHGITVQIFSETQLIVQATPIHLKNQNLTEIFGQFIGWIHQENNDDIQRVSKLLHEKIRTKMACSAAIKAGDSLTDEQMLHLLTKLQKSENRFSCPHGRPTFWTLPINQIEKQFKRDYTKKAEQYYDFI